MVAVSAVPFGLGLVADFYISMYVIDECLTNMHAADSLSPIDTLLSWLEVLVISVCHAVDTQTRN